MRSYWLLCGLGLACAPHQEVAPRVADRKAGDYAATYGRWTRELKLYNGFETAMLMRATLETDEFRRAASDEIAFRAALTAPEIAERRAQDQAAGQAAHELMLGVARTAGGHIELGAAVDSPWRLRLSVDGRPCEALKIERVMVPDPQLMALFPQANTWSDVWDARFSTDCGSTGEYLLVISGVSGSGELRWQVAG